MTAANETNRQDHPGKTWQRRGLFAAAAAFIAGVVARVSEQRVEAGTDGDVVLGAVSTTTMQTAVVNNANPGVVGTTGALISIRSTDITNAFGGTLAVFGLTDLPAGAGVRGSSSAADGTGVTGDGGAVGVDGFGTQPAGIGVRGLSFAGVGMYGQIPSGSNTNAIAIYGVNASSYAGSVPGTGGWGVVGVSRYGHGVLGATSALGAGAVVGNAYGITGAYAGIFFGRAIVEGDFTVVGGAKSAAVPHPDGSHRRLYCLESPESWFEDFGEDQLTCGQAEIRFDPDFAAVVAVDRYHVFLTGYDDFELRVRERTAVGFRVEAKDATASGRFSWRVVAKRKDIASPRFEPVTVPPKPEMPAIPDPPAWSTPPVVRRHH